MRFGAVIALFVLAACGSNPSGPTPVPPASITVQGTLTDTVSGAVLGSFTQTVAALPALIDVSASGHLPRRARITSDRPTVDLIPDAAPFDLTFYRQLVRGSLDGPLQPVRVLTSSPSIYLQRTGLSDATVAALEQAARAVVPALTGGRLQVAAWETGETARSLQNGWIMVELVNDSANCGRALIGAVAGRITLNVAERCLRNDTIVPAVFQHELGHSLGLWHVSDGLMRNPTFTNATVTEAERYHAAIAYARSAGNIDVDQDVLTSAVVAPMVSD